MSKVGKVPVAIPDGVKVSISQALITVAGKHGQLTQEFRPDLINIAVEGGTAKVTRKQEGKQYRAFQGLYRSLLANMVHGVAQKWEKSLLVKGLGYRARLQGSTLILDLGYSNPMEYKLPDGIEAELPNPNEIIIRGIDKQQVGHVAAKIRALRKPNVYSGKGIRYKDEAVLRKAGKLGGAGAG
ncbi:50S ribosomal protein L6 [Candidatus Bipolaricaulota bacterium]|nr:50S ribosomal protein L6 [Candidatus Bipolaricaulota bacterium]HHR84846.1 50S ribosomal protein L6 [Candidatus Acetothermia bacterium]